MDEVEDGKEGRKVGNFELVVVWVCTGSKNRLLGRSYGEVKRRCHWTLSTICNCSMYQLMVVGFVSGSNSL